MFNRALICLIFGILNVVGANELKKVVITYSASDCISNVCTQTKNLDFKTRTFIYVNYDFLTTSYFIFSKGSSYIDLFKKKNYNTDTSDCYPVSTFADYASVMKKLNLTYSNSKVAAGLLVNDGKGRIEPCGLKAALYNHIGSLAVYQSSLLVSLNTRDVIHSRYYNYLAKGDNDFTDVTEGRFFGWYLPGMPAHGTKILWAVAENGLIGDTVFSFDKSRKY